MMIAIIGPSLVLALLIAYEIHKNTAKERKASDEFWEKERLANSSRKKDISNLPYIRVPLDTLPFGLCPAFEEITQNEKHIRELATHKIYSLRGLSNSDVKLEYGVTNFEFLCKCDEYYLQLLQALSKESELLHSLSFDKEAETVLNYSLSIGSDIPKDYLLLADIYRERFDRASLNDLIERAEGLDILTKESLLKQLEAVADKF